MELKRLALAASLSLMGMSLQSHAIMVTSGFPVQSKFEQGKNLLIKSFSLSCNSKDVNLNVQSLGQEKQIAETSVMMPFKVDLTFDATNTKQGIVKSSFSDIDQKQWIADRADGTVEVRDYGTGKYSYEFSFRDASKESDNYVVTVSLEDVDQLPAESIRTINQDLKKVMVDVYKVEGWANNHKRVDEMGTVQLSDCHVNMTLEEGQHD